MLCCRMLCNGSLQNLMAKDSSNHFIIISNRSGGWPGLDGSCLECLIQLQLGATGAGVISEDFSSLTCLVVDVGYWLGLQLGVWTGFYTLPP